jgi:hypothetical protein
MRMMPGESEMSPKRTTPPPTSPASAPGSSGVAADPPVFPRRHEEDLAEIRALAEDLDRHACESQRQLALIKEIQNREVLRARLRRSAARLRAAADDRQARSVAGDERAEPMLAFVHIPKTAGKTVITMLAAAYTRQAVGNTGNYVRSPEKTRRKLVRPPNSGVRLLPGHVPYAVLRAHLPDDTRYMTFLREPVDRVLSHYHRHIQIRDRRRAGRARDFPSDGWKARARSIEEALVELRLPQINNLATRFLCGHPFSTEELPANALEDAKANLSQFAFVGIQERFDESVVLLQRALGMGLVPYLHRHVSAAGNRPAVEETPEEQRALIAKHNRLDADLYRFALDLFEDTVPAADERFAADVERLRALSAEAEDKAIRDAREWADRTLPAGTTRLSKAVRSAARADGVLIPELKIVCGSRQ